MSTAWSEQYFRTLDSACFVPSTRLARQDLVQAKDELITMTRVSKLFGNTSHEMEALVWGRLTLFASLHRLLAESPPPQVRVFLAHFPFQHIHYVLSDHRHELESVSGSSSCDVKSIVSWRGAYPEVDVFGISVPTHTCRDPLPVGQFWHHVSNKLSHLLFDLSRYAIFGEVLVRVTEGRSLDVRIVVVRDETTAANLEQTVFVGWEQNACISCQEEIELKLLATDLVQSHPQSEEFGIFRLLLE